MACNAMRPHWWGGDYLTKTFVILELRNLGSLKTKEELLTHIKYLWEQMEKVSIGFVTSAGEFPHQGSIHFRWVRIIVANDLN